MVFKYGRAFSVLLFLNGSMSRYFDTFLVNGYGVTSTRMLCKSLSENNSIFKLTILDNEPGISLLNESTSTNTIYGSILAVAGVPVITIS